MVQQRAGCPGKPAQGRRSQTTPLPPALSVGSAALAVLTLKCSSNMPVALHHSKVHKIVWMAQGLGPSLCWPADKEAAYTMSA